MLRVATVPGAAKVALTAVAVLTVTLQVALFFRVVVHFEASGRVGGRNR